MKKRLVALLVLALTIVLVFTSCDLIDKIKDMINPEPPVVETQEYVVYFLAGEGIGVPSQTVKSGELVKKPEDPYKEGFLFDAWYKDSEYTVAWNFDTDKVEKNTILYAKWNEHTHTGGTATCTEKAICDVCGHAYGSLLDHVGGEATCTEKALCEVCGTPYGQPLGHDVVVIEGKAPTCTETGLTDGAYCTRCDAKVEQEVIDALGHTPVVDEAVAPTCTETGLTEGSHCSVCNEVLVAQEVVDALGHRLENVPPIKPTCTEPGRTGYQECSREGCDYETLSAILAPKGHTPVVDEAVAPTCVKTGLTEGSHCSVCNEVLVAQAPVDTVAHTFVDGVCVICEAEYVAPDGEWTLTTVLQNGNRVLIGAPAYGKLLSAEKVTATSFYNKGVSYSADDFTNVTDAEIFVVTVNADGTYTFTSLTGDVIALAASYSSLNATGEHKSWALTDRGDGTFLVKNTGRNLYLEWYDSKGNWSTYSAGNTAEYYLSFYVMKEAEGEHVHNHISSVVAPTCTAAGYTSYTCSCGDTYKVDGDAATGHNYVPTVTDPTCTEAGYTTYTCVCGDSYKEDGEPATGHNYVDGKCHCGEVDPDHVQPGAPVVEGGSADFDTIKTTNANGDSSYTKTFTTANGWVVAYSAIQAGGSTVMNPQFPVIGPDNTHKAVCLNGKTSAPGKVTSPTLTTGISKLTINYTKMFTDTKLSVTVTITELATGTKYTHTISKELNKDEKYVVYTEEWVLETPVVGDFTIEIVNNCPSNNNSNKDRFTILDLSWEGAAAAHVHEYAETTTATCTAAGVTTYTCECGDTYTEEVGALGHVDANLDVECDRDGCTSKVAPAADSLLSNFTANCLGSKLSTSFKYYVEGVIVEVLDQKNGIFLIDDGTGEKFYFRLPVNAEGVSHANWAIKLTLGDKVSVYGKINKYTTSSAPNGQYWPAMQGGVATLLEQHTHDFTFKPAGCTDPAYCVCGQSYGDPRGCVDADGDTICDDCGRNANYTYEHLEIRTDNNSGVIDTTAGTYTWSNNNFDVQVSKGTSTQLYSTAKDHMRIYKNNNLVISSKNGIVIKTITVYVTNATQVTNFEKFLTGYTYTKDVENFSITIEINSAETLTFTNPASTTQIKGIEFGYEKAGV